MASGFGAMPCEPKRRGLAMATGSTGSVLGGGIGAGVVVCCRRK